jgi:hypothetical protein
MIILRALGADCSEKRAECMPYLPIDVQRLRSAIGAPPPTAPLSPRDAQRAQKLPTRLVAVSIVTARAMHGSSSLHARQSAARPIDAACMRHTS